MYESRSMMYSRSTFSSDRVSFLNLGMVSCHIVTPCNLWCSVSCDTLYIFAVACILKLLHLLNVSMARRIFASLLVVGIFGC